MIKPRQLSDSSVGLALYGVLMISLFISTAWQEGIRQGVVLRPCPSINGQELVSVNRLTGQCNYMRVRGAK